MTPAGLAIYHSRGNYKLPKHINYFNRLALDVAARRIKRLIIAVPPRHGKSEYWSQYFPAWYIPTVKHERIMLTTYEATFAESWGRKARDVVYDVGEEVFGLTVSNTVSRSSWWNIGKYKGGMNTAGVGGAITGKGANILIIDDPIKNKMEAMSETYRENIWDWYKSVARTRLEPNGAIIIIMARWHEHDLVGKLLNNNEPDKDNIPWTYVNIKPFAEKNDILGRAVGEPLWPEQYDTQALNEIRNDIGNFWWNALYDGNPREREGGMFPRHNFKLERVAPLNTKPIRIWDFAGTEGSDNPDAKYTAGGLFTKKNGKLYVMDMKRKKLSPGGVAKLIKQTAQLDGKQTKIYIEQEPGSSGKHLINFYKTQILQGYPVFGILPSGSKIVRADPLSAQAEAGNVILIEGQWINDFLDEAELFPHGTYSDQIDVTAYAYEILLPERIKIKTGMRAS